MADPYKNNPANSQTGLFRALTRLFSGPIVSYRSQSGRRIRRQHLDKFGTRFKSASGQQFKKTLYSPLDAIASNAIGNQRRSERYIDFDQMEYCLHGDTRIAVPGGYKTIKELAEEYGTTEQFVVYAYDHAKKQIVPAFGKQARKTTTDHAWKITFENGQEIIGTNNHRLMLRDGTYRRIDELEIGMAMMPFYRKDLVKSKTDEGDGYRWIYTMHNDEGRRPGWKAEHIAIAEWVANRRMLDTEVVHHINFDKSDNDPENLVIMDNDEHLKMHQGILNTQRNRDGWWKEFGERHSKWMKENNPAERKDITFEKILYLCETHGFHQKRICSMLDTDPGVIKRRLRNKGFKDFVSFAKTYEPTWKNEGQDNAGSKNPRFDGTLSYQKICEEFKEGMSSNELATKLGTTYMKIVNRVKTQGFKNFTDFKNNYHNHKVAKIEYYGFIDLYDLTVDGYKSFATDTVISHNSPEIASTMDIYADEMTTFSELRPMLNIKCPNEEIEAVLGVLFENILNVKYNLFGWARTMCKYGDFFLYLDIDEKYGVQSVIALPTQEVERLEGMDSTNPNYIQYQWNTAGMTFENWQIAHFRVLGNDKYAPYGTCHKFDTRVWSKDGVIEIQNVVKGDVVWSFDTKNQKKVLTSVLDVVASGKKRCYMIRTRHNFLETSEEHRIAVYTEEEGFNYKNTLELKIGDLLVIDGGFDYDKETLIDKSVPNENKNGWWNSSRLVPDKVDENFAKLFGFLIGDGWLHKTNQTIDFAAGEHQSINNKYIDILKEFTGKEPKYIKSKDTTLEYSQVRFHSKMFKTILQRMGFEGDARTKRVPSWVFGANKRIRTAFLRGMMDADGSIFIDKWNCCRYSFELANEQLTKDLKVLCQSLGYKTGKIGSRRRTGVKIKDRVLNASPCYYFYYFESKLSQAKKYDLCNRKTDDFILSPVTAIESTGVHETYDIHVENENHNFISNGILTHNSILEPARRIFRQLTLMEDAMMAYRVIRSSERRVFKIDVGAIPPQDVEQYMQKVVTNLKRHSVVDPTTGKIDLRYNPMSIEEDYFIPVRPGSVTDIQSLAGAQNITQIDDIKYLRDKLFSALKIPQSYLTMGEGAEEDKTTLAQKDIRFARTIQRLQRVIIAELTKIGIIHLYTLGFRGDDLLSFELTLNNPSKIAELQEIEFWKSKFDIAGAATEGYFSRRWVTEKIFGMSHEEFIRNQREMYYDRKHDAALQQVAEALAAEGGMGGGGLEGDLGGDLGGDMDLGGPEEIPAGDIAGDELGGGGEEPAGDESALLAVPPGSRNEPRLTPGAKGKVYHPKKVDRRNAGARKRSNAAKYSREKASSTTRNILPGMGDLQTLVKMDGVSSGIYEEEDPTYKTGELLEESQLFHVNNSIRELLSGLDSQIQEATEKQDEDKT